MGDNREPVLSSERVWLDDVIPEDADHVELEQMDLAANYEDRRPLLAGRAVLIHNWDSGFTHIPISQPSLLVDIFARLSHVHQELFPRELGMERCTLVHASYSRFVLLLSSAGHPLEEKGAMGTSYRCRDSDLWIHFHDRSSHGKIQRT